MENDKKSSFFEMLLWYTGNDNFSKISGKARFGSWCGVSLNRCINAEEHTEEYMDILKEIADRTDVDKAIKESAQEFVDFQANR